MEDWNVIETPDESETINSRYAVNHDHSKILHQNGSGLKKSKNVNTDSSQHKNESQNAAQTNDAVNHPSHYCQGGIECIDAIKAAVEDMPGFLGFCTGNALKYIWRWMYKGGEEDLDKAIWYLMRLKGEVKHD